MNDALWGYVVPEIHVPLNLFPLSLLSTKSLKEILCPLNWVSSGGVMRKTERTMRPKTARMTRVAMNIPFQFRSLPLLATSSCNKSSRKSSSQCWTQKCNNNQHFTLIITTITTIATTTSSITTSLMGPGSFSITFVMAENPPAWGQNFLMGWFDMVGNFLTSWF